MLHNNPGSCQLVLIDVYFALSDEEGSATSSPQGTVQQQIADTCGSVLQQRCVGALYVTLLHAVCLALHVAASVSQQSGCQYDPGGPAEKCHQNRAVSSGSSQSNNTHLLTERQHWQGRLKFLKHISVEQRSYGRARLNHAAASYSSWVSDDILLQSVTGMCCFQTEDIQLVPLTKAMHSRQNRHHSADVAWLALPCEQKTPNRLAISQQELCTAARTEDIAGIATSHTYALLLEQSTVHLLFQSTSAMHSCQNSSHLAVRGIKRYAPHAL